MTTDLRTLSPGIFFGEHRRDLATPSFTFAEMLADCPEEQVPPHTHLSAHFVLVLRGVYLTAAQPGEGPCGPSTLIFNPTGTTHQDRFRGGDGKFLTISVSPEIAAEIEGQVYAPIAFTSGVITATIRRAYGEFQALNEFSVMIMEGLGLELAGRVGLCQSHPAKKVPNWLRMARELIRDCCTTGVGIKEIARAADVHPIHLARAFRRYFKCSPGEFLRQCRMEKVEQLLDSEMPLADLALQVGFSDQSQLTNVFKQLRGMTPGEYRRTFNKDVS
jgi:AraC family transcriptional regulator